MPVTELLCHSLAKGKAGNTLRTKAPMSLVPTQVTITTPPWRQHSPWPQVAAPHATMPPLIHANCALLSFLNQTILVNQSRCCWDTSSIFLTMLQQEQVQVMPTGGQLSLHTCRAGKVSDVPLCFPRPYWEEWDPSTSLTLMLHLHLHSPSPRSSHKGFANTVHVSFPPPTAI